VIPNSAKLDARAPDSEGAAVSTVGSRDPASAAVSERPAPARSSGSFATEVSLLDPGSEPPPPWCSLGCTPVVSCEGKDTAATPVPDAERSSGSFATEVSLMEPGREPTPSQCRPGLAPSFSVDGKDVVFALAGYNQ
jgi:hypothetical protein